MNTNLNVHPIFVHFPIALLTVYSIFELIRHGKLNSRSEWFWVKAILLVLGTLGAFAALATGDSAARMHRDVRTLVHTHENFAQVTTFLYVVLSANYLVVAIDKLFSGRVLPKDFKKFWNLVIKLRTFIFRPWFTITLALIALIALLITGALGGAIAYGPNTDPFTSAAYNLFVGGK